MSQFMIYYTHTPNVGQNKKEKLMEEKKDVDCGSGTFAGGCGKGCGKGCCESGSVGRKGESYGSRLAREAIEKMDEESKNKSEANGKCDGKPEFAEELDPVIDFIVECVSGGKNPISVAANIANDAGILLCGFSGGDGKCKNGDANNQLMRFLMNVISSYTAVRTYREVYNNGIGAAEAVNILLGHGCPGEDGGSGGVEFIRKIIHIWGD